MHDTRFDTLGRPTVETTMADHWAADGGHEADHQVDGDSPTPEQIAERSAGIRDNWSHAERRRRGCWQS